MASSPSLKIVDHAPASSASIAASLASCASHHLLPPVLLQLFTQACYISSAMLRGVECFIALVQNNLRFVNETEERKLEGGFVSSSTFGSSGSIERRKKKKHKTILPTG
ncbi:unnamed protein product [Camellia sinensis]